MAGTTPTSGSRKTACRSALGVPKEGIFTWVCGIVMHSETKNEEASYDLINGVSSPEAGAFEIENLGFGHANRKAFDLVAPEKLAELGPVDTGMN